MMFRKINKKIALAIVVCILIVGLMLFGQKRQQPIVLEFGMFTGSNWDVANANSFIIIDEAIERFEKEHPGVKIHYYSGIRKDDYSEWLSRKLLSGEEPDVFMVLGNDFNQFASMGVLKDLQNNILYDKEFETDRYFTSAYQTGQYEERQYALPYETVPTLMFVNKSLLTKEGIEMPDSDWTWQDLYSICVRVTKDTDGDGMIDQFGTCNYGWMDAVCCSGASLFREDGKECNFTDEGVCDAIKLVRQINNLYANQKVTQEDFNAGNVAFMPLTFAEYRTYKTYPYRIKKYANFQWDCITMPAGESGNNLSQVDTLLLGVSEHTKHEQIAWEFIKLLTYDKEIQTDIFRYSQGASVLKDVTESEEMENIVLQNMAVGDTIINRHLLSKVIEEGYVQPQFKKYEQAMSLADSEMNQILGSDKTIESSLKLLQRSINEFLSQ